MKDINRKLLISIINQIINKSVKDNDKREEIKIIKMIKKLNRFLLIRIYLIENKIHILKKYNLNRKLKKYLIINLTF